MLIDDDPVTNLVNTKLIEKTGVSCEVTVALSGRQALEILLERVEKAQPLPDLIILDINMPLVNGFEFLHYLDQLNLREMQRTKIVILSSSDDMEDRQKARQLGIDMYLVKPVTANIVANLLQ
jgi:CheY-like chemotaxis protein